MSTTAVVAIASMAMIPFQDITRFITECCKGATCKTLELNSLQHPVQFESILSAFPNVNDLPFLSIKATSNDTLKNQDVQYCLGYGKWKVDLEKQTLSQGNETQKKEKFSVFYEREMKNEGSSSASGKPLEILKLIVVQHRWEDLKIFIAGAMEKHRSQHSDKLCIYNPQIGGIWSAPQRIIKRSLSSIILPKKLINDITKDIQWFFSEKGSTFYQSMGLNYRRGYVLHGIPGMGKTSLVYALASHFQKDLYNISLTDPRISDMFLKEFVSQIPSASIILMEDVDTIFNFDNQIGQRKSATVSRDQILNVLDGLSSYIGSILFMTTNHYDKIIKHDPAFLRAGRGDKVFEFQSPDFSLVYDYIQRFPPIENKARSLILQIATKLPNIATLQELMIRLETNRNTDVVDKKTDLEVVNEWMAPFHQTN